MQTNFKCQFCFKCKRKWRIRSESAANIITENVSDTSKQLLVEQDRNCFRVPITRDLIKKRLINIRRTTNTW